MCYGRGKFPGHHVLQKTAKGGTDTSGWVHMDSIGCIGPHEQRSTKNRGGKTQKLVWTGYLRMRVNAQTKHLVGRGGLGGHKGS